jgi:hypothetical protein
MREIDPNLVGEIFIVKIPQSAAPGDVDLEWVGLTLPCLFMNDIQECEAVDIIQGKEVEWHPSYAVWQDWALDALRAKCPRAAKYWEDAGFPTEENAMFFFSTDVVEVVKPVMTKNEFYKLYLRNLDS